MAVTVYRSTDSSAPTLSGTAGDLVNLLDKCLVAGYGSKTAAGWSKPYTGTNAASFRQGAGNQFYLDVNDNAPGTGAAREARVVGYEAMTAVATGTAPFPTVAQKSIGLVIRKSAAASGATRVWTLIADDRTMYLFVQAGDTAGLWYGFTFGDVYSFYSGTDNYRTVIIGRGFENDAAATSDLLDGLSSPPSGLSAVVAGHYMARSYTGLGASIQVGAIGATHFNAGFGTLVGTMTLPSPVDGRIWLAPVYVNHPTLALRGKMRGFMHFLHPVASFADQDTVTGDGDYSGHTFLLFKTTGNAAAYCIDVTGPWPTN